MALTFILLLHLLTVEREYIKNISAKWFNLAKEYLSIEWKQILDEIKLYKNMLGNI